MKKRAFDLFWALAGLAFLWPFFILAGLFIKIEDGGPVFFRQTRTGKHGRPFRIWKFRTMVPQAEAHGGALTVGNDQRITRVGKKLRSTKLDELPQLINVLTGEMSFVGPRPEVKKYTDLYTAEQLRVLAFRPGITDPASLKYRNENEILGSVDDPEAYYRNIIMPDKIRINLEYATRGGLMSDFMVILRTIFR